MAKTEDIPNKPRSRGMPKAYTSFGTRQLKVKVVASWCASRRPHHSHIPTVNCFSPLNFLAHCSSKCISLVLSLRLTLVHSSRTSAAALWMATTLF